jgi:hypothetical protein
MVNQWLLTKELIVDVVANTTNKNFKYPNIKQTSSGILWDYAQKVQDIIADILLKLKS